MTSLMALGYPPLLSPLFKFDTVKLSVEQVSVL